MIDDGSVAIQMVPTWGPSSTAKLTVLEGKFNTFPNNVFQFPLVSTFQGRYRVESQTRCLLVLTVYKPNLSCSSLANTLIS